MRGPDLAKLLRESGFEHVKTHMTVLDDADLMVVEARLSAQGLKKQPVSPDAGSAALPKKKSLAATAEEGVEAEAEVPPLQPARKDLPKKSLPAPKPLGKKPAPKKDDHEAEVEAPP
ncbi:MAG: hypothetical protein JNL12_21765, partial [Planctomycetes bacterium]|nr:hypothetical protein [Planctomycetota bacterium]